MRCYGDKPRSFMQINPSGGIPVAVIKGKTIAESNDIMQELEDKYPNHNPLLPGKSSPQSARVAPLLKLERQAFSHWFSWLTSRSGVYIYIYTDVYMNMYVYVCTYLWEYVYAYKNNLCFLIGICIPLGASAAVEMDKILITIDRELGVAAGPYFLGTVA
jgi:glutathione S-transferase